MAGPIYVLGGYQTDFSANWARNGMELADGIREVLAQGLDAVELEPRDLETVHVGNFAAELFCNQGHLGGLVAAAHPDLAGVPASRHEGACASGSLAALAASAELEAGRYRDPPQTRRTPRPSGARIRRSVLGRSPAIIWRARARAGSRAATRTWR